MYFVAKIKFQMYSYRCIVSSLSETVLKEKNLNISGLLLYIHLPEEGIIVPYRWLWVNMWLQGIELMTFERAAGAPNLWAISPAPSNSFNVPFECSS